MKKNGKLNGSRPKPARTPKAAPELPNYILRTAEPEIKTIYAVLSPLSITPAGLYGKWYLAKMKSMQEKKRTGFKHPIIKQYMLA